MSVSVGHVETLPAHTGRDLSWLDFDRRVFELASDPRRPPAERLKLFAIVASNLDEFFAVRVARLEAHDDEQQDETAGVHLGATLALGSAGTAYAGAGATSIRPLLAASIMAA